MGTEVEGLRKAYCPEAKLRGGTSARRHSCHLGPLGRFSAGHSISGLFFISTSNPAVERESNLRLCELVDAARHSTLNHLKQEDD